VQPRPRIAVLDYGIGNLRSAQKALARVGADAALTADPGEVAAADGVVLPGVGAFGRSAEALRAASVEPVVHAAVAPHARAGGSGRPAEGRGGRGIPNISWGGEPEAPRQGWEAARRQT